MRHILLSVAIGCLALPAMAQTSQPTLIDARHPGPDHPLPTGKTELQKEAERVEAYRRAMGLDQQTDVPARPQTLRQMPAAPNGLSEMSLYQTPASASVHHVKKGDTLFNISKRYGVTVPSIRRVNQLKGTTIKLGQSLMIPPRQNVMNNAQTVSPDVIVNPVPRPANLNRNVNASKTALTVYAVAYKDTISAISRRTCVPVKTLLAANSLENPNALKPGQRLNLPVGHCLNR